MAAIEIKGRTYELRMDLNAMEQIEAEFGDLYETLKKFQGNRRSMAMIKPMFRILANSGQQHNGKPEDVTGNEIGDLGFAGINELSKAFNATMQEALKTETTGGNAADDEAHDEYLEELEQQEKNA